MTPKSNQKLEDFDPIIILGPTIHFIEGDFEKDCEATRREREIFNALEKGKLVCLTFQIDQRARANAVERLNSYPIQVSL